VTRHRVDEIAGLEAALGAASHAGLLFAAHAAPGDGWDGVEAELQRAFELTREAFAHAEPIVYLVRQEDLLGQAGAPGAMLATALLSAARALATEDRDATTQVNVLAYADPADPGLLAGWARTLLEQPGVTGELIQVGRAHLGRIVL
jgi:hypothetical protein